MNKSISSKLAFFALSVLVTPVVFAVGDDSPFGSMQKNREEQMEKLEKKEIREVDREEMKAQREQLIKDKTGVRCENRGTRIDNKLNMFDRTHRFHFAQYKRIQERLTNLIARLNEKGIDTTVLEGNLVTLQSMVATLETKYQNLKDALTALKEVPCEDVGGVKNSLSEITPLLEDLKNTTQDIREFIVGTIKPELKRLKAELQALKPESDSES